MNRPLISITIKSPPWLTARVVAGAGAFLLTIMVFVMLWSKPELADNDLFKTLAQAVVVQGLVGLAMAHWFTSAARRSAPQGEGEAG